KAENLMEDALARMTKPNANEVDRLRAEEEIDEAVQIRNSVLPQLSEYQQKALTGLNLAEKDGILRAAFPPTAATGKWEFELGKQENQSLIDWIQSEA